MSTLLAQNMLLFAGEAFAISALVVALAWQTTHLLRDRASLRHLVWAGAFIALLLLPLLAWLVPAQIHVRIPAATVIHVAPPVDMPETVAVSTATPVAAAARPAHVIHIDIATIAFGVLSLYLAGVCAIALRGLAAVFGLHALKRASRAYAFDDLPRGRYQVRLSKTPNGYGPITWGLFRPIILLPFNAQFWPRERLQAVLLHEAAHIARRDSLCQLLSLVVCALYWPNPFVWLAARALRNEAELAADDQVIASGMRPSSYAGELLQLASEFRSRQPALAGMPLFMAAPSALEARVKSVLAPTQLRSGVTAMDVLKIGGVAIVAAAALTFARPTLAQDAPAPVETAPLPAPAAPASPAALTPPAPVAPLPAEPVQPPVARIEPVHPIIKVRESTHTVHGHKVRHIWMDVDTRGASAEELERMRPEMERAEAEMRDAQPRLERAQAELQRQEARLRELQEQMPQIQAQLGAELARIQPEIDRAIAQSHIEHLKISNTIDNAMKHMKLRIEIKRTPDDAPDAPQDAPQDPQDDEAPHAN